MDIPASPPTFSFPRITRRRRHTNTGASPSQMQPSTSAQPLTHPVHSPNNTTPVPPTAQPITNPVAMSQIAEPPLEGDRQTYRIRLVPHLESARSLHFEPIIRDVKVGGPPLRVGRFTDRATNPPRGNGLNPNDRSSDKVAFRSKVVSRAHAELWVQGKGMFFLKDTKSSSGTFINHMRLSPPGQESVAHILKDGDIIQLGVDYQGGTEEMYRCVKIKVEVGQGREWQGGANAFNTAALKQLRTLQAGESPNKGFQRKAVGDCCICLYGVSVCQSLFIAPCSHAFHYKCIRPMLELHHPGFSCPLCRTFADLEADVEVDEQELKAIADALDEAEEELANQPLAALPSFKSGHKHARPAGSTVDDAILVDSDEGGVSLSNHRLPRQPEIIGAPQLSGPQDGPQQTSVSVGDIPITSGRDVNGSLRDSALDDRLVEDALEVDYDGEDDDGDERMVFSSADEFGGQIVEDNVEATVSPRKRSLDYGDRASPSGSRVAPLKIDSRRRVEADADIQADREAREFANATTPLNNTFIAVPNSLLGAVPNSVAGSQTGSQSSRPEHPPELPYSFGADRAGHEEDDGTGTEAENGNHHGQTRRVGLGSALEAPAGRSASEAARGASIPHPTSAPSG